MNYLNYLIQIKWLGGKRGHELNKINNIFILFNRRRVGELIN